MNAVERDMVSPQIINITAVPAQRLLNTPRITLAVVIFTKEAESTFTFLVFLEITGEVL